MKKIGFNLFLAATLVATNAMASVIPIGVGAFPASALLVNFTGIPTNTEVNGLTTNGLVFNYSLGNGQVIIDGGPGVTNNISPQNIVSVGNNTGILTITLPFASTMFGYGYAVLASIPIAAATTISIFSGATPLGMLAYSGVPDPAFTGGFAGLTSTIPFDRVALTFASGVAPAFALDNVRVSAALAAIPEPSTILLMLASLLFLLGNSRSKTGTRGLPMSDGTA